MSDTAYRGHRVERFLVEVLDLSDRVLGTLDGVDDDAGTLDLSIFATIRGSANLRLSRPDAREIDWTKHRIRVSYQTGDLDPEPLITGIPRAPVEKHTDEGVGIDVELYDKTLLLSEDRFPGPYGLPAGTPIVDAVRQIIASTGEQTEVLGDSTAVLASGMVWDADVTKLRACNDLLDAGGMFALQADGMGRFRADPYTDPASRAVTWTFDGLYLPTWSRDRDTSSVPNRFVCVRRRQDESVPADVATATDVDPASPYSFPARGRWITRTDLDVEASSVAVLELIAQRRLMETQRVTENLEITHPWLPIRLNDAVRFSHERLPRPVRGVVQRQSIALSVGGLVTSTIRRVS